MQQMVLGYVLAGFVSAAMLAAPSLVAARDGVSAEPAIVAIGRHAVLARPDAQGRYAMSVSVADLDTSTPAGRSALAARVERAALTLCEAAAEGPSIDGFYNRGQRDCWQSVRDQAKGLTASPNRIAANR